MSQQEAYTNRIHALALGTAEVSPPTAVALGSSIDFDSEGDWTAAPFNLADEDIDIQPVEEDNMVIKPPTASLKFDQVEFGDGIERVVFTSYEIGAQVMGWATNLTESSGTWTSSATHANRVAIVLEFAKQGYLYLPSVTIKMGAIKGGPKKPATQGVIIDVFGTSTYPSGYLQEVYAAA